MNGRPTRTAFFTTHRRISIVSAVYDQDAVHRVLQIVAEAPKHERIVCSDAANTRNEDFARAAFIIYKTPDKAAKAVQKLNKMRIYQSPRPKSEGLVVQLG